MLYQAHHSIWVINSAVPVCCWYVAVFLLTILVCTRSPHKDSEKRKNLTSGDIFPVPTRKKAILGLMVRFRYWVTIRVRISFRIKR